MKLPQDPSQMWPLRSVDKGDLTNHTIGNRLADQETHSYCRESLCLSWRIWYRVWPSDSLQKWCQFSTPSSIHVLCHVTSQFSLSKDSVGFLIHWFWPDLVTCSANSMQVKWQCANSEFRPQEVLCASTLFLGTLPSPYEQVHHMCFYSLLWNPAITIWTITYHTPRHGAEMSCLADTILDQPVASLPTSW